MLNQCQKGKLLGVLFAVLVVSSIITGTNLKGNIVAASPTTVFQDGFESGSLSKWSGGASAVMVQSPVHSGSYAGKTTGPNSYWYKNLGSGYSNLFFAGYVQIQSALSNGQTTLFLNILDSSYAYIVSGGLRLDGSGNARWGLRVNSNWYSSASSVNVLTGQWYFMEIQYSTSGTASLWVDGNLVASATGQTLSGSAQIIQGGNPTSVTPTGFVSYGDDYTADTSYISPSSPTPTPTPSPTPTPTAVFQDGFESGSLSKWSGGASAVMVQSPVHSGSYAGKTTGPNSYWYKNLGSGYSNLFFAGYVQIQSALSNGQTTLFLNILDSSYAYIVSGGLRLDGSGNARWGLRVNSNWYSSASSVNVLTGQWYFMEIQYSTSGTASLWVDGNLVASATGQTLSGSAQIIQGGNPTSVTPTGFVSYGDDYTADTSYISPSSPTPTPTPSPTPTPTAVFQDGFESGSLSKWSGGGASAVMVQSPVHSGSYAGKTTGPNSYWYKNLGSGYSNLFFAGYVQIQSALSNGQTTLFLNILDSSYAYIVSGGLRLDGSGNARWGLRVNSNWYSSASSVNVLTGQWYFMEIQYSTSGTASLWVDGNLVASATGQTLSGSAQIIQGGNPTSVTPTGFVSYGDDYTADTSYISPSSPTPTPTPSPTPTPTSSPTPTPSPVSGDWLHTSGVNIYDSNNNQIVWNGVTTPTLFGYESGARGGVLLESISPTDINTIASHGLNFVRIDLQLNTALYGQDYHYQTPTKLNYYPRFWTLLDSIVAQAATKGMWVEILFDSTTISGIGGYWGVTNGFPTWMYNGSWSYFNKIYPNDGAGYTHAQRDFWNINDPTAANVRTTYQTWWKDVAYHYRDTPNVIFSLYNEPQCGGGFATESLWGVSGQPTQAQGAQMFKSFMESTIDVIRSQDNGNHVIVSTLAYFWYLDYNLKIDRPNVVVEGHEYSGVGTDFFNLSWRYNQPFLLSEFGGVESGYSSRATTITQIQTCNQNNVSWCYLRYDRVAPSTQTWIDLQNNLTPNLTYYH